LLAGFARVGDFSRKILPVSVFFVALIFAAGLPRAHQTSEVVFRASELPSQAGRVLDFTRIAEQGIDSPGFLSYGPYVSLAKGEYEVVMMYSSSGDGVGTIGWFDIFDATSGVKLSQSALQGTNNAVRELKVEFQLDKLGGDTFEFRTYWDGVLNIKVHHILLRKK
jgi:hypothetical protein